MGLARDMREWRRRWWVCGDGGKREGATRRTGTTQPSIMYHACIMHHVPPTATENGILARTITTESGGHGLRGWPGLLEEDRMAIR